ncbi:hypothetical protein ACFLZJ_00015 [Nanoarchaeota archaeon]
MKKGVGVSLILLCLTLVLSLSLISAVTTCSETDFGKKPYIRGTTTQTVVIEGYMGPGSTTVTEETDDCDPDKANHVLEYFCEQYCPPGGTCANIMKSESIDCPDGCSEDACIDAATKCIESDGGRTDYTTKGNVYIEGEGGAKFDECVGRLDIREYWCTSNNQITQEIVGCRTLGDDYWCNSGMCLECPDPIKNTCKDGDVWEFCKTIPLKQVEECSSRGCSSLTAECIGACTSGDKKCNAQGEVSLCLFDSWSVGIPCGNGEICSEGECIEDDTPTPSCTNGAACTKNNVGGDSTCDNVPGKKVCNSDGSFSCDISATSHEGICNAIKIGDKTIQCGNWDRCGKTPLVCGGCGDGNCNGPPVGDGQCYGGNGDDEEEDNVCEPGETSSCTGAYGSCSNVPGTKTCKSDGSGWRSCYTNEATHNQLCASQDLECGNWDRCGKTIVCGGCGDGSCSGPPSGNGQCYYGPSCTVTNTKASSKCSNNDIYYYDNCGKKRDKKTECETAGCTGTNAVCDPVCDPLAKDQVCVGAIDCGQYYDGCADFYDCGTCDGGFTCIENHDSTGGTCTEIDESKPDLKVKNIIWSPAPVVDGDFDEVKVVVKNIGGKGVVYNMGGIGISIYSGNISNIDEAGFSSWEIADTGFYFDLPALVTKTFTFNLSEYGSSPGPFEAKKYTIMAYVNLTLKTYANGTEVGRLDDGNWDNNIRTEYFDLSANDTGGEDDDDTSGTPTSTCVDSDTGKEYDVKGAVTVNSVKSTDFCYTPQKVREYYCTSENKSASILQTCNHGCGTGACLAQGEIDDEDYVPPTYTRDDEESQGGNKSLGWIIAVVVLILLVAIVAFFIFKKFKKGPIPSQRPGPRPGGPRPGYPVRPTPAQRPTQRPVQRPVQRSGQRPVLTRRPGY